MGKTTEQKTVVKMAEGTKVTRVEVVDGGRAIEIYSIFEAINDFDRKFPIVEASMLSLEDEFMKYEPRTNDQMWLKTKLESGIKAGLHDFRRPAMDPALENEEIVYRAGLKPAVGKPFIWWRKKAKEFMPAMNSRLGNTTEYAAFLGVLIKYLIKEMGYNVRVAWEVVCVDSHVLGCYENSAKRSGYELTGSRAIGPWSDLANTWKVLDNEESEDEGYVNASGCYRDNSYDVPLAAVEYVEPEDLNAFLSSSVGWLVMDV